MSENHPHTPPPAPGWPHVIPATVYIFWGVNDEPLYVGCTTRQYVRFDGHGFKPWWTDVARIDVEHFEDRGFARMRERLLIRELRPLHNVAANPDHDPRVAPRPVRAAA